MQPTDKLLPIINSHILKHFFYPLGKTGIAKISFPQVIEFLQQGAEVILLPGWNFEVLKGTDCQ